MLSLEIDGINYQGWTSVQITRSLEDITGSFELTFTDQFRNDDLSPIQAGDSCRIYRDGELQKTGFVDAISPSFNKDEVTLVVSGRDNPDIADCSVNHPTGEWKNLKFEGVVAAIIAPFGRAIDLRVVDTGDPIKSVNYDQGTKAYELIRKYGEKKQLLLYSGLDAKIIIDVAGIELADIALIEGDNILEASGNIDYSEIFSVYTVKGDRPSTPQDKTEEETQSKADFEDKTLGRNRPLIIMSDGQTTNGTAEQVAKWEATTRLAKSETYSIKVQGWHNVINKLVTVNSPTLKLVNAQKLISAVTLVQNQDGEHTIFTLVPKNAFDPTPGELLEADKNNSRWAKFNILTPRIT